MSVGLRFRQRRCIQKCRQTWNILYKQSSMPIKQTQTQN